MNMKELADIVADTEKNESSKAQVERNLRSAFEAITDAMRAGEEVTIPGFGKFSVTERAARTARNPATGENVSVPAKKAPAFKAAKGLKESVNL
ncbi:HU family DNA-binding protein [Thioalkalivibrio sp. ALgr3]|uniref:HU family DNA-binding protein n=1 Tax=Thioalkalivibrio sp. ALgr3 TaxID=1239292 RepID=UPI0003AAF578|nr:HU family DNA-binding protein [Thioalkalivibrio sp. ALgr3]